MSGVQMRSATVTEQKFPKELKDTGSKIYATYYTTRKDNEWAKAHPEEIQQMYIMTSFHTATEEKLEIHLMDHLYPDMLKVNSHDDIKRWWEVTDRTTGEVVPTDSWSYSEETGDVTIHGAKAFHDYTVSFLAYIMWDPVHMYNAVVNDWKGVEKQITFDVRQPKTKEFSMKRLRKFIEDNPHVDVIRYTTFFHQFTLISMNWQEKICRLVRIFCICQPVYFRAVREGSGIQIQTRVYY